jgi:hypothetical protein
MTFRALLTLSLVAAASPALAELDLPRPSPNAKVWQTVGLTEITVDYSSPGVKGRKVWGTVVPWDKLWRAGANAATKVTFSKDVTVDGKSVPAGTYALFVIPAAKGPWTVILNKDANQFGTGRDYKKENDVARVAVKPQAVPMRERLVYQVVDFTDDKASLDLEWEKVRLSVPIGIGTAQQALANIKEASDNAWRTWNAAARYMLESKKDYDAGIALADKSISMKEDWFNTWTKAQLLAAKGRYKDALALAQKADALGGKSEGYFFSDEVKKAIGEWKNK